MMNRSQFRWVIGVARGCCCCHQLQPYCNQDELTVNTAVCAILKFAIVGLRRFVDQSINELLKMESFSDISSLKRVRTCEDVRALSAVCCKTAPSQRALGDFTELPIEVIHNILDYLPSNCFKFIRNNTSYIVCSIIHFNYLFYFILLYLLYHIYII